jgi:hypothetical protein
MEQPQYYEPSHGPTIIFMLMEQKLAVLAAAPLLLATFLTLLLQQGLLFFVLVAVLSPLVVITSLICWLVASSWRGQVNVHVNILDRSHIATQAHAFLV